MSSPQSISQERREVMSDSHGTRASPASRLRSLLGDTRSSARCELMPACHDALSAKLIADHDRYQYEVLEHYRS